jgi:hypothetical protein
LNTPGHYQHWAVFTTSVANLIVLAIMLVIFALAVLPPFAAGQPFPPATRAPDSHPDSEAGPAARAVGLCARRRLLAALIAVSASGAISPV